MNKDNKKNGIFEEPSHLKEILIAHFLMALFNFYLFIYFSYSVLHKPAISTAVLGGKGLQY